MKKRIFSMLLALCLLFSMLPATAVAAASDTTPPVLQDIKLSATKITAPGKVTMTVTAADSGSGVESAFAMFYGSESNEFVQLILTKQSNGKLQGTFEVNESEPVGSYQMLSLFISDKAGNQVGYAVNPVEDQVALPPELRIVAFDIVSKYSSDKTIPTLTNITLSKTGVTAPGEITVTMTATDDLSGADKAYVSFYCRDLRQEIDCSLRKISDGVLQGTIEINQWQAGGTFKIDGVQLFDEANNCSVYIAQPDLDEPTPLLPEKLRNLSFTVTAPKPDKTPPVMQSLTFSSTKVNKTGKVTVTMKATDDISGVAQAVMYFNEVNGPIVHLSKQSDGTLQATIQGAGECPGVYTIESISVYDNAGNAETYFGSSLPSYLKGFKFTVTNAKDPVAVKKASYTKTGKTASVSIKDAPAGSTYQWYIKNAGATKFTKSSVTSAAYNVKMSSKVNGRQVYCVVTDKDGDTYTTNTVTLRIAAEITKQPKSQAVAAGKKITFKTEAIGTGLKYQWQVSTNGKTWKNCSGTAAQKAKFSLTGTTSRHGNYYRCKVTDKAGNVVYTNKVRAYVLGITTQPKSQRVETGEKLNFTVKATGAGLKYQWQVSTNGKTWKNCSGTAAQKAKFSLTGTTSRHGNYYRCKITDSVGNVVYSSKVRAYVFGIKTQPVKQIVTRGEVAKFSVSATGIGLKYQWQYSTDGGKTWKSCPGDTANRATFIIMGRIGRNGYYYRCKITDSAKNVLYTGKVKLTVKE